MTAPLFDLTPPQSNDGDWVFGYQVREFEDGQPMWIGAPPTDLVATLYLIDRCGRSIFSMRSDDGTQRLHILNDAWIDIIIPASNMSAISADRYKVHIKFTTLGRTMPRTIGYLSVTEGPQ